MKVDIKGTTYRVNFYKNYGVAGETNTRDKVISIENDKNSVEQWKTILHELIHAFLYECGLLELSHNETLAYWLENNILQIIELADKIHKKHLKNK